MKDLVSMLLLGVVAFALGSWLGGTWKSVNASQPAAAQQPTAGQDPDQDCARKAASQNAEEYRIDNNGVCWFQLPSGGWSTIMSLHDSEWTYAWPTEIPPAQSATYERWCTHWADMKSTEYRFKAPETCWVVERSTGEWVSLPASRLLLDREFYVWVQAGMP